MKTVLYPILAGLTVIGVAYPQSEVPRFSGSIGGGFTTPVYGTGQRWSLTLDPVIHFAASKKFNPYIIGGGGLYHRTIDFTAPALANGFGFDPFFGIYPGTIVANQILSSNTVNKPGFNAGAGFCIPLGSSKMKLFAEAR